VTRCSRFGGPEAHPFTVHSILYSSATICALAPNMLSGADFQAVNVPAQEQPPAVSAQNLRLSRMAKARGMRQSP
jgi:hypothetical protein